MIIITIITTIIIIIIIIISFHWHMKTYVAMYISKSTYYLCFACYATQKHSILIISCNKIVLSDLVYALKLDCSSL